MASAFRMSSWTPRARTMMAQTLMYTNCLAFGLRDYRVSKVSALFSDLPAWGCHAVGSKPRASAGAQLLLMSFNSAFYEFLAFVGGS